MKMLSVVSASLIILSQCAAAEDFEPGLYIAGGPSAVTETSSCAFASTSCNMPATGPTRSATYRAIVGYNAERTFGIEAGVTSFGTFNVKNPSGAPVGSFRATATTLGFRAGRLRSQGFSGFGEFGLASVRTDYTPLPAWVLNGDRHQRSTGYYLGGGVQFDLNKTVAFRASANYVIFSDAEFQMVMPNISIMAVVKL